MSELSSRTSRLHHNQYLLEDILYHQSQTSGIRGKLNKRGIIRNSVSDYSRSFVSPSTNQSIKEAGVDSILLIEAVKKCLGEIPGFEIKVHYNSTNSRGTIYFVDEDKLRNYSQEPLVKDQWHEVNAQLNTFGLRYNY